jgi:hypothetical protein
MAAATPAADVPGESTALTQEREVWASDRRRRSTRGRHGDRSHARYSEEHASPRGGWWAPRAFHNNTRREEVMVLPREVFTHVLVGFGPPCHAALC